MKCNATLMAILLLSILSISLSPSSANAQVFGGVKSVVLMGPYAESGPEVVYVVVDFLGKQEVYALHPDRGETVHTALKRMGTLPRHGNLTYRVWVQRPDGAGGDDLVLPVDWDGLGEFGNPATDHLLLPGDRIFVSRAFAEVPRLMRYQDPLERIWGPIRDGGAVIWGNMTYLFGRCQTGQ